MPTAQQTSTSIRVDFSLKREVFFVVIGAIIGAVTFVIPKTIFEVEMGLPYYLTWIAFGHVVGVYSSESVIYGIVFRFAFVSTFWKYGNSI